MKCTKSDVFHIYDKLVYFEDEGIVKIYNQEVFCVVTKKVDIPIESLYYQNINKTMINIGRNISWGNFLKSEKWDKIQFFIKSGDFHDVGFKTIKIDAIKFKLKYRKQVIEHGKIIGKQSEFSEKYIVYNTPEQMFEENFTVLDDVELDRPLLSELKEGSLYYLLDEGTVKIIKMYEYPTSNHKICRVETLFGKEIDINDSLYNMYNVPTKKRKNPLGILDKSLNEISLQPYVVRKNETFNVYWKKIEEAAQYIVYLYRIIAENDTVDLYLLKEYVLDRNEQLLVVDGLIGNTFVFKVAAENRNGEVIALSRGVNNGYPNYFTKEV